MALDFNTVLNYTDKTTIRNWFKTGLKPTQTQFWSTWDSFWHKSESLPISSITNLGNLLDSKAEENHTHSQYATNDATSLTAENVTAWQKKLGVDDLDYVEIPTENATENSHPYVVVIDDIGKSAKRNATDFGKVDTIDGIEADENKNIALGAVRKSESNTVTDDFSINQENGAFVSIGLNGLKVGFGGITATYGTSSIYVDNLVPDAAYKFQEILFPKRAVKNVEEKVYPVTYVQGVKADETGRVDISGIAWNYTSPSIRYSGLLDKSADATFNQLLGVDSNGNAAKVGLNAITNAMAKSTDAQKDAFRLASRKSTETYSTGQPVVDNFIPSIIDGNITYPQTITLTGLNLFLNNSEPSLAVVKLVRVKDVNGVSIPPEKYLMSNIEVYTNFRSVLTFSDLWSNYPEGFYKAEVTHNGLVNLVSPELLISKNLSDTPKSYESMVSHSFKFPTSLNVNDNLITKTFTNLGDLSVENRTKVATITADELIRGFKISFKVKVNPSGTELGNIFMRTSFKLSLGSSQPVDAPDIISPIRVYTEQLLTNYGGIGFVLGGKNMYMTCLPTEMNFDIDIIVKSGNVSYSVRRLEDNMILNNLELFTQSNESLCVYTEFKSGRDNSLGSFNGTKMIVQLPKNIQVFN